MPLALHATACRGRIFSRCGSCSSSSPSLLVVHVALLFVHPAPRRAADKADASTSASCSTSAAAATSRSTTAPTSAPSAPRRSSAPDVRFIEPGEGSDREAGLRLLAAEGMDLVIGVGFIFTDDLTQLAKEYPNTQVRRRRLRARDRHDGQCHSAAAEPRRAQVPRGGRLVPRRRARRARRQVEEGRLRRRHGHPAHPQVRGGLHAPA